ncbi:hypothetical protein OG982_19720 [Streptomyces sp. NBC_01551]|uniref:hypothetical protein n=1 Tax=Streptomyces sp. NBC_01551 TaxID=2975876 RepID=UPI0022546DFB|nr:hypothetical protein [Streptomyces sp. NBC_01551]MCX4527884.1 hypothetical protein [Streptomyces sp. NBC_01551]
MRGANQLLAGSSGWAGAGAGSGAGAPPVAGVGGSAARTGAGPGSGAASTRVGRGRPTGPGSRGGAAAGSGAAASVSASAAATGLRTTTGGIGREPGMLIRIRVVRVVSVFGPSVSGVDGFDVTGFSSGAVAAASVDGYWPVPYGGVPEG